MIRIINAKKYEEFREYVENNYIGKNDLIDIVASNDTYFIEYIIAKGINLHVYYVEKWTLLFWASAPVIPILLSNGLDINSTDIYGCTALMTSCYNGYFDAACELIRNGCDINVIDCHGNTALSRAIERYNFKLVEVLIEKGAIGIQTTLYRHITANKLQLSNLTEQTKDLMMYRDFYELTHFEFCRLVSYA